MSRSSFSSKSSIGACGRIGGGLLLCGSLSFIGYFVVVVVLGILFDRDCTGYLKRAADSNTIALAEKELGRAVGYIEQNNLTSGYTSIVYNTPDEDVGFWYTNLKASHEELKSMSPNTTPLEMSNMLMKLRETILDGASRGVRVTVPEGISKFPSNTFFALWGIISGLATGLGVLMVWIELQL